MADAFDPVLIEVINNELGAVTEEMAMIIWRSGQSSQLRSGDFATAVCDHRGRIIGHGFAAPFQLAIFEELMRHVVAVRGGTFRQGDVYITNDPYAGMGHLPDFAVIVPVVLEGETQGFCVSYSHHSDVGGRFPGSFSSEGTSSYEEGVRVPILRLKEDGHLNEAVLDLVRANVRVPDEWVGDIQAKISGCERGADQVAHLIRRHGRENYLKACDHAIDRGERSMRAAIAATPDGVYHASYTMADHNAPIELKLALTVSGDEMIADFSGSSLQLSHALNAPLSMTRAGVLGALKCVIGPDLPANSGFFRPVNIVVPRGSVLNPTFPAPVAGRAPVFFRVFDLVFAALAKALPGRVPVIGEGGDALHFSGRDAQGRETSFLDLFFGGWGARPHADGVDGVAPVFMGSYGSVSIEMLEAEQPVLFEGFGFVADSEGPGRYRGSAAIFRQWRFLEPGHVMVRTGRLEAAGGLDGGQPAAAARSVLIRNGEERQLAPATHVHFDVEADDVVYHSTAGAGGYGDPFERADARVVADVKTGMISLRHARERYGVVLTDGVFDPTETARLRRRPAGSMPA